MYSATSSASARIAEFATCVDYSHLPRRVNTDIVATNLLKTMSYAVSVILEKTAGSALRQALQRSPDSLG
jgi:hypothetical protein